LSRVPHLAGTFRPWSPSSSPLRNCEAAKGYCTAKG
jgi:hypothetical protein